MSWLVGPNSQSMMTFSPGNIYQNNITILTKQGTDYRFTANLVSIRNQEENKQIADNTGLENETEIICQTFSEQIKRRSSSFLNFPGI